MARVVLTNIEAERVRHRQSRNQLCEILGVSTKTYFSWISGKTEIPSSRLRLMGETWNVSVDYLLEQYPEAE